MTPAPYKTINSTGSDELVEKRSRFIGTAMPVTTEEQALAFIAELKSKYWDATHNVYAYILRDSGIKRYSDDGEPSGTAGIPTLDVLQKEGLTDLAVVVTRYFGGTMLGAGGLVRAYGKTAKLAVDACGIKTMTPCTAFVLELGYDMYGKVSHLLPRFGAVTKGSDFGAVVRLELALESARYTSFCSELREISADTIVPAKEHQVYFDLD